jgi:hypothetical protein
MITLNKTVQGHNVAPMIAAPTMVRLGPASQPVRPEAIPCPYPIPKDSPAFAAYHGFTDTNEPVLRRVY